MAVPVRALTRNPGYIPERSSLVTAITSCLQSLDPRSPNPTAPLNQFSSQLDTKLVVEVIEKQQKPQQALVFFNWALNPCPNPNKYAHNHRCYVAITDLLLSHSLFSAASSLLEKSNKLSDLLASKFILAHASRGQIKSAIYWYHRARKIVEGGKCLFSFNALLGALVKANKVDLAKSFFDEVVKDSAFEPDVSSYTTLIGGFCKMGRVEDARKVFDEMDCLPNSVTYNALIDGYCKKGDMEKARMILYRMMESWHCLPDTVTFTILVDGHCKKGEFDEAMKWMSEMEIRGCKPNLLTYNAVIYGLCLRGNVDEAKKLMVKMRLNGMKANVATHTSILKGLCIAEKFGEAVKYFKKEMIDKGMEAEEKAYAVAINAYCKLRKPERAIFLLKEMRGKGISPSVRHFNTVLRNLTELGELERAVFLLKQMKKMGCAQNFMSYDPVICGLCKAKGRMREAEVLVNYMLRGGISMDASMYGCLVSGYCEERNVEMAMQVFHEAIDKKYVINRDSFLVFVKLLTEKGRVVEAKQIFEEMCMRCAVIDVDCYQKILDDQLSIHYEKHWEATNS